MLARKWSFYQDKLWFCDLIANPPQNKKNKWNSLLTIGISIPIFSLKQLTEWSLWIPFNKEFQPCCREVKWRAPLGRSQVDEHDDNCLSSYNFQIFCCLHSWFKNFKIARLNDFNFGNYYSFTMQIGTATDHQYSSIINNGPTEAFPLPHRPGTARTT